MGLKNYIYLLIFSLVSFFLNIILAVWLFFTYNIDSKINDDIQKSKGRIEVLQERLNAYSINTKDLQLKKDSVTALLSKKTKEQIVIKNVYENKIDSVVNLPIDSSVLLLAKRLSETDLD
tara:strand:- start:2275 stop:2634 length:360 start_codon:yes stop_codon:yes gene_type:complete